MSALKLFCSPLTQYRLSLISLIDTFFPLGSTGRSTNTSTTKIPYTNKSLQK